MDKRRLQNPNVPAGEKQFDAFQDEMEHLEEDVQRMGLGETVKRLLLTFIRVPDGSDEPRPEREPGAPEQPPGLFVAYVGVLYGILVLGLVAIIVTVVVALVLNFS